MLSLEELYTELAYLEISGYESVFDMNISHLMILLSVSVLLGALVKRIGLVSVIGFIVGGLVFYYISPLLGVDAVELTSDPFISLLSFLGLILLGFEIGSEISMNVLRPMLRNIILLELIESVIIWNLWSVISFFLGLSLIEHLVLFLITINTSTGILYKAFREFSESSGELYRLALSATAIEDLIAVFGMSILLEISRNPDIYSNLSTGLVSIMIFLGKIVLLVALSLYLGVRLFKRASVRVDIELFALLALSIALLYSTISIFLGVSFFLGAFIAGVSLGTAIDPRPLTLRLAVLRDLGLLLYFSTIGLTLPVYFRDFIGGSIAILLLGVLTVVIVMLFKYVGFTISAWTVGSSLRDAIRIGFYTTSISELGIVITQELAKQRVILGVYVWTAILIFTLSSLLSNTLVVKRDRISSLILRFIPRELHESSVRDRILRSSVSKKISTTLIDFLLILVAVIVFLEVQRGLRYLGVGISLETFYIDLMSLSIILWIFGLFIIRHFSNRLREREHTTTPAIYEIYKLIILSGVLATLLFTQIRIIILIPQIRGYELIDLLAQLLLASISTVFSAYITNRYIIPSLKQRS